MAQLLLRNLPDHLVESLERRAAAAGISAEEAHRQILSEALESPSDAQSFKEHLLAMPDVGEDWMFDRKDPRNKRPEKPPISFEEPAAPAPEPNEYTLFDHFRKLGEIAPDFDFVYERKDEPPRPLDLE